MTGSGLWQNPLPLNTANPVALYEGSGTFTNGQTTTVKPVSSVTSPIAGFAIGDELAYELSFSAINHNLSQPFYQVILTFYDDDAANAVPVDQTMWWLPAGVVSSGNPCIVVGHGPLRGLYMQMQIVIPAGGDLDISYTVRGTGRSSYVRDDWREQWPIQVVPGYTRPNNDSISCANMGSQTTPQSLAAGATASRLLPLYSGWAQYHYVVSGLTTNQMEFSHIPQNILGNSGSQQNKITDQFLGTSSASQLFSNVYLPQDMIVLRVSNNSSVTGTATWTEWPQYY